MTNGRIASIFENFSDFPPPIPILVNGNSSSGLSRPKTKKKVHFTKYWELEDWIHTDTLSSSGTESTVVTGEDIPTLEKRKKKYRTTKVWSFNSRRTAEGRTGSYRWQRFTNFFNRNRSVPTLRQWTVDQWSMAHEWCPSVKSQGHASS